MARWIAGFGIAIVLAAAGCTSGRGGGDLGIGTDLPETDGTAPACAGCHGTGSPWNPPPDSRGHVDPAFRGVGAHAIHVGGGIGAKVACDTCHAVPARVDAQGHIDTPLPAEVLFSGRAALDGLAPGTSAPSDEPQAPVACSNVYCHGATLDGGTATEPTWNGDDTARFGRCGACHGIPVTTIRGGGAHPAATDCSKCHGEVVGADGSIVDATKHVDGIVQATGGGACNSCHGSADNPAPPVDPEGNSDTTVVTVGAHQKHLNATRGHPVACTSCHKVPGAVDDAGHADGKGDVEFHDLAVKGGAAPEWSESAATCSGTYCHGSAELGGANPAPKWTSVDGTQAACGSCHALPPPSPHPDSDACSTCHGEVVKADRSFLDAAKHVDGTVQVAGTSCTSCHGNEDNAAPPKDTSGSDDTTRVTVGAHQSHLKTTAGIFAAVPCTTCHKVPQAVGDEGHMDGQPDVEFAGRATTDGATPAWDGTTATCAGSYCHGATISGGSLTNPKWTEVDGTQAACGNCHGLPPLPPHPQAQDCARCHGEVINADRTFKAPSRHVDGTVDVIPGAECKTCHGSDDNAAPPKDLDGESDTARVTVGAHQSHLKGAAGLFATVSCSACHVVPGSTSDPTHTDGEIQVTFHGNALADGATPAWNEGTATCSGAYCHGATLGGGTNRTPKWTRVDGSQVQCGACHALPPPSPHPATDLDCVVCHQQTMGPDRAIVHPEAHVNGQVDVADVTTCNACHGGADNPAPPKDLSGSSDTARVTVGAHQKHLQATDGLSSPVPCATCHRVPAGFDDAGHVDSPAPAEVTFGGMSDDGGATPAWDRGTATCTNTYCHGATLSGGSAKAPVWTNMDGSQIACGSCHGFPPTQGHSAVSNCFECHSDTVGEDNAIAHPGKHIDGTVQVKLPTDCTACHGSAANAAPPKDANGSSDTSKVTVGAHQRHLAATLGKPVACAECHVVPTTAGIPAHLGGPTAALTFGALATDDGANPAWDRGTATCTNSYCHGATLAGGTDKAPTWTDLDGSEKACGTCHGNPPPGPDHPQAPGCGYCHVPTAAKGGGIADPSRHVDGTLDVRTNFACNACHGSADSNAPPTDLAGSSDVSQVTVGAHQAHLKGTSNLAVALTCDDCHKVPGAVGDEGHMDTLAPAEVTFGTKARLDGAGNPAWNRTTAQCSGTYCHGSTLPAGGATNRTPTWTTVNDTQDACGTCHGVSPRTGKHPSVLDDHAGLRCYNCHKSTATNADTPAISDKTKHVNGTVEVVLNVSGTYNASTGACSPACHIGEVTNPQYW